MSQDKFVPHSDAAYRNTPKDKRTPAQQAYIDAQVQTAIERITRLYAHEDVFQKELAAAFAERYAPKPALHTEMEIDEPVTTQTLDVFR